MEIEKEQEFLVASVEKTIQETAPPAEPAVATELTSTEPVEAVDEAQPAGVEPPTAAAEAITPAPKPEAEAKPGENFWSLLEGYKGLRRGDVVTGKVVRVDQDGILVDVGSKSEGIIATSEVDSKQATRLQVGDEVLVYVLQPEITEGHVLLSLNRAQAEQDWLQAKQQMAADEILELDVVGYNKGGLIVRLEDIRGFVPASQAAELRGRSNEPAETRMAKMVGKKLVLKIIEVERSRNRLILSEVLALKPWRDKCKEKLLSELQVGEVRPGRVSSLCDFGAFVDLGGADGLIHISQLSWKPVAHPRDILQVGDEVNVYVIAVDQQKKRIALSLKQLEPEPWAQVAEKYHVGDLVTATITKLATFGAFARLEEGVEGLIHVTELTEGRVAHPSHVVKVGDVLTLRIVRMDPARRRLGLSLRRAEPSPEYDPAPEQPQAEEDTEDHE
jgi:small subunit ribosomal protein S1